jgi:hypothetical protein
VVHLKLREHACHLLLRRHLRDEAKPDEAYRRGALEAVRSRAPLSYP